MVDIVSRKKRSEIMRAVKSCGTKLEISFCRMLRENGLRFKRNDKSCFGKPDFSLKKIKTAVFIDSCFWHGCRSHCRMPKSHSGYWKQKIQNNKARDKQVNKWYKKQGWKIIRIWEHAIKTNSQMQVEKVLRRVMPERSIPSHIRKS